MVQLMVELYHTLYLLLSTGLCPRQSNKAEQAHICWVSPMTVLADLLVIELHGYMPTLCQLSLDRLRGTEGVDCKLTLMFRQTVVVLGTI